MVKVQWQHHTLEKTMWELEEGMQKKFSDLFVINLEDQSFLRWGNATPQNFRA